MGIWAAFALCPKRCAGNFCNQAIALIENWLAAGSMPVTGAG
jgi:hypothetical protein